ncbi:MAG: CaiB/BaiF CoA transferase family protein [Myxococcota bacterium]
MSSLPLDEFTVLDLSSVGPAARAARILADYGGTVVKISPPRRKGTVQIEPPYFAYGAARGYRKLRIDLKAAEGRALFLRLAERADVLIESFRPGVMARLGLGYDDVRSVNERIVYCSTSGYGQSGPYASWAGHDLNYLALGGYLHCSGRAAEGGPALPGATIADAAAGGMHAALAILAALLRREREGTSTYLDVAVTDGVLSLMSLHVDEHLATGVEPGPRHDLLTGRYACYDLYPAADGRWLAVAAIEPAFFANLCKALGLEQWIPYQLEDAHQDEIRAAFREVFARRSRDEWVAELAPAGTCVSPVSSIPELVRDPHLESRGAFVEIEDPAQGRFRQLGALLAGSERRGHPPRAETDTRELLADLDLAAGEIEALHAAGVVE